MNLEEFKNFSLGKTIGYGYHDGYGYGGECGELASYWLSELTGNKYQMAYGKPNIAAQWCIGSDCETAWNVATQSDWGAMGFDIIYNPSFSQLKAGDIFFISARGSLTTGHVGIVYSADNNNVTTLEQNFNGARYTQLMAGANSWSYYGGFSCIVRLKQKEEKPKPNKPTEKKKGNNNMIVIHTEENNYIVTSEGYYTWIPAQDVYNRLKGILPETHMTDKQMRGMFKNFKDEKG